MLNPRTITVVDTPLLLRGRQIPISLPAWPDKDPGETLDYHLDLGPVLKAGDTLTAAAAVSVDNTLAIVTQPAVAGAAVTLIIAGGIDGQRPVVAVRATTAAGDVIVRSFELPIVAQLGSASLGLPPVSGGGGGTGTGTGTGGTAGQATTSQAATIGAVPGLLSTLVILPRSVSACRVTGQVVAQDIASGSCAIWDIATALKRPALGSPLSWIGAPCVLLFAADADMTACSLSWTLGTDSPELALTGIASRSLSWTASLINTVSGAI